MIQQAEPRGNLRPVSSPAWLFVRWFAYCILTVVVVLPIGLIAPEGLTLVLLMISPMLAGYLFVRPSLCPTIIKRLRARGRYEITSYAVWNPSRGPSARLIAWGHSTYWLDDDGLVHLLHRTRTGAERHLTGALPPPPPRAASSGIWLVIGLYGLAGVVGDTLGYQLSSGDDTSRSTVGVFGALGGFAIAYVVLHVGLVTRLLVKARRSH